MAKKSYTIGISNRNAPSLYRSYNCFDHLFPYEPKRDMVDFESAKLTAALEAFESLVAHKLGVFGRRPMESAVAGAYGRAVGADKALQRLLVTSPEARVVSVELSPDERQVYLCRNYLTELNENIAQLGDIAVFQTCCNYLRYLPCGIGQLRSLKMLILSRNRLVELPDEIGLCRELREIDVSFNLLKRLPRSLAGLHRLNTLHIAGNRFATLPGFLGKLGALKYLNVGHNPLTHIPLEVFKLPFLLSLAAESCAFSSTRRYSEIGALTVRELAARAIVRNNLFVDRSILAPARDYLLSVQECSFCGGPFFEHFIEIEDLHSFETTLYPVYYRMCCRHYSNHDDRLRVLFEASMPTVPTRLFHDNMPSVTELFEPYCFNDSQLKRMNEGVAGDGHRMPLISLAKYNTYFYRKFGIEKLLEENTEDLNVFDV